MYVVTRRDLSPGDQACQASHAAFQFAVEHADFTEAWFRDSNYLVLLAAEDESALGLLAARAEERGLRCVRCCEPDFGDALTAVVIEAGDEASRLCSNLPLALREEALV